MHAEYDDQYESRGNKNAPEHGGYNVLSDKTVINGKTWSEFKS